MDFDKLVSDDAVDNDPQSQVAAQGLKQGASAMLDSGNGSVAQAPMEGVTPESDPITDAIGASVVSKMAEGAADIIGNEIGSLGYRMSPAGAEAEQAMKIAADTVKGKASGEFTQAETPQGKVINDIKQSGKLLQPNGVQINTQGKTPNFGKVTWDKTPTVQGTTGKVTQKFADGGDVSAAPAMDFDSMQADAPQPQLNTNTQSLQVSGGAQLPPNPTLSFDSLKDDNETYGTTEQMLKTAAEGTAEGAIGPFAPLIETKLLGVQADAIRARAATNPGIKAASNIGALAGSMLTGVGEGALIGKAGLATAKLVGEGSNLAKLVGRGVASGFVENALLSGGDEISKMIVNDPTSSVHSAAANIGLSGLLGAGIGGGIGATGALWKATFGNKLGQIAEDFKGRTAEHLADPDPVASITKELTDNYTNVKAAADEVYGPTGLKAQELSKVMPEMSNEIANQSNDITDKLQQAITKLKTDDHLPLLQDEAQKYSQALVSQNPEQIFNATQDLKQQLQEWGKYNKAISPLNERAFRNVSKDLAFELRTSLEDTGVWGKAAERQAAINGAFKEYLPALKDFEKKFTVEVGGEKVIDPGKIQTYVNQSGKASAEIKQSMLKNFLDASDKYKDVIATTHANLGLESPIVNSPLNAVRASLKEKTTGARLADIFIEKGLTKAGGQAMGASVGGALGHAAGVPGFGAIIGANALGPFFSSVLPAIAKPVLRMAGSGDGFRAAAQYGAAVHKGDSMLTKAVKSIFDSAKDVAPRPFIMAQGDQDKLDKKLQKLQQDPSSLITASGHLNHYLPDHAAAMGNTTANAVNYLNSLRPSTTKANPMDSDRVPSAVEKAKYGRALTIAERPTTIVDSIKAGSLTPTDVIMLRNLYPAMYNSIAQKMTSEMTNEIHKGNIVPYKVRQSMSLFLGQPMDSTFTPNAIQAAQMSGMANRGPQGMPGTPQMQQGPAPKKTNAPLNKLSGAYQTVNQAQEASHLKK